MRSSLRSARQSLTRWGPYRILLSNVAVPPLLVLAIALAVTSMAFVLSQRSVQDTAQSEAEQRATVIEQRLRSQLDTQEQVLKGGAGRLESGPIDRQAWHQFVGAYGLPGSVPGVQLLGAGEVVNPGGAASFEQRMSAEYGKNIKIFPAATSAESIHAAITYLEPSSAGTLRAIGYDGFSDPERKKAMQSAAASGETALTGIVGLGGSATDPNNSGMVMYRPYYDRSLPTATSEERQRAVRGYVFAALAAGSAFDQMLAPELITNTDIDIYVGGAHRQIYSHAAAPGSDTIATVSHRFTQFGQTFEIDYGFTRASLVASSQLSTPRAILAVGLLSSFLLSLMTYFLLHSRYDRLAREKDYEVQLAKDELLSLASHQLRTPATGVKQYLGMVVQGLAGDITKQQEDLLKKAYASNDRQLRIINDILHLAKIDTGRVVLAKTTFDLAAMIRDASEEQRGEATAGRLALDVKVPKRARYHGDEHMLRMVVENLLSNAIKYTPPEGHVTIRLRPNATNYKIAVSDTGVGIDPSQKHRLFQQFTRLDNPLSGHVTGTGIGLYLAKHLTGLHKGNITVESTPGLGSTFTVTLPRKML